MTAATDTITTEAVEAAVQQALAAQATLDQTDRVVDPWGVGGEPIEIGRVFTRDEMNRIENQTQCHQRCAGAPGVGGYGYCQREHGHDPKLKHFVAYEYDRTVKWVWETQVDEKDAVPGEVEGDIDAADAKVETFTIGLRVNKRNERGVLMVLSVPKKRDEKVEILDLAHQRFRKIRRDTLVPARDDDAEITPEQMTWVSQFIADRRANVFEIGMREVTNGRWSKATALESLAKIGISEPPVQYGTTVNVSIDLKLPGRDLNLDQAAVQAAFEAALRTAAAATLPEGYTVRRVHNINVDGVTEIR